MNKRSMAVAALILLLLAVALYFALRGSSVTGRAPVAAVPTVPSASTSAVPGIGGSRPGDSAPPPWATGSGQAPSVAPGAAVLSGQPSPADKAAAAQRESKELEQMQLEIAEMLRNGKQPDPKRVAEMLTSLKQKHGAIVAGVNLDVVLNNLQVAQEIQTLALEIQRESSKPGGGDSKKMQAYVAQLTKLQAQMRMDITVPQKPVAAK